MGNRKRFLEIPLLLAFDCLSLVCSLILAFLVRQAVLPEIYPLPLPEITDRNIRHLLWIFLVWLFFFFHEGLYDKRFSFWDEIKTVWKAVFLSTVAVFVIISIGKLSDYVSRTHIILTGLFALTITPFVRIRMQAVMRRAGIFTRRVLIIGAGPLGRLCLSALRRESNYGFDVIGFVDDNPVLGRKIDDIRVHRKLDRVDRYIRRCRISAVLIAMPELDQERQEEMINRMQFLVKRVLFVPDLRSVPAIGAEVHHFFHDRIFSLEIRNNLKIPYNLFIKRLFDVSVSLMLAAILAVPMAILCLVIRAGSSGCPIFPHRRNGMGGSPFHIYKFRTMYRDADKRLLELLERDENARREWETYRKLKNDPRITPVGRFLRQTSLDELPQLFNVILGEMSLVGPRPVTQEEITLHYREMKDICFSVLPGITGLWQVSGRNELDYPYRIMLDAWYVRNWSLWLDIVIILKTVRVVIKGEGAY